MTIVLVAACALIDTDGRVLLAQRPEGKPMAGLWEFPGGKVEAGERPEQSLIRELNEELGITVKEACLAPLTFASHSYPDFHLLMPLYVCRRWEGTVTPLEGQRLAWVRPNKLRDYAMPEADVPLISHLMATAVTGASPMRGFNLTGTASSLLDGRARRHRDRVRDDRVRRQRRHPGRGDARSAQPCRPTLRNALQPVLTLSSDPAFRPSIFPWRRARRPAAASPSPA